jgi:hypothetical protein
MEINDTPTKTPLSPDEFDEVAVVAECERFWKEIRGCTGNTLAIHMTRYQHSKDKAVIQELRAEVAELKNKFIGHEDCRETSKGWHECMRNMETEIQALKAEKGKAELLNQFYLEGLEKSEVEIADLKKTLQEMANTCAAFGVKMDNTRRDLEDKHAELTKALEFYADKGNWTTRAYGEGEPEPPNIFDTVSGADVVDGIGGKLAREVLNKQRGE